MPTPLASRAGSTQLGRIGEPGLTVKRASKREGSGLKIEVLAYDSPSIDHLYSRYLAP